MAKQLVNFETITEIEDISRFNIRGNRVLFKPGDQMEKTPQGIFLPETASKGMLMASEVIKVGKNVEDIKVGDTVFLFLHTADPGCVKQGENIYYWISDYNIIAVLDK